MKKRRLLSLALCVAMLCSLVGAPTYADEAAQPTTQPAEETTVGIESELSEEETLVGNTEDSSEEQTQDVPEGELSREAALAETEGIPSGEGTSAENSDALLPENANHQGDAPVEGEVDGDGDEAPVPEASESDEAPAPDEPQDGETTVPEAGAEDAADAPAADQPEISDGAEDITPDVDAGAVEDIVAGGEDSDTTNGSADDEQTEVGSSTPEIEEQTPVSTMAAQESALTALAAVPGPTISIDTTGSHSGNQYCGAVTVTVNAQAKIKSFTVNGGEQSGTTYTAPAAPMGNGAFNPVTYSIRVEDENGKTATASFEVRHTIGGISRLDIPPTCTEPGGFNQEFLCGTCGQVVMELDDSWRNEKPLGHTFEDAPDGGTFKCGDVTGTYQVCTVCGFKQYTAQDGTVLEHQWGEETKTKKATCTEEGYEYKECVRCGATEIIKGTGKHALGHSLSMVSKPATCDAPGESYQKCTRNGCSYETNRVSTDVLGHAYNRLDVTEQGHRHICVRCGKPNPDDSDYHEHIRGPEPQLCTEPVKCTECGYTIEAGASEHVLTCQDSTTAQHELRCTNEGCTYTTLVNHRYPTNADDCTAEVACEDCGHKMQPNLVHAYTDTWQRDSSGHYHKCTRCNHREDFAAHTPAHAGAGCTESFTCGICGYVMSSGYASHIWSDWQPIDATTHRRSCTRTGCPVTETASHRTTVIEEIIVPPTCDQAGTRTTTTICMDCRYVVKQPRNWTMLATGHKFTDWERVDGDPCTGGSYQKRTCTTCGKVEYKDKVEGQHSWTAEKEVIKEATCTAKGTKAFRCTLCNAYDPSSYEDIPLAEHQLSEEPVMVVEASCLKDRVEVYRCETCKADFTTIVAGSAKTHLFGEYTSNNDATCTTDATQSAHCEYCGAVDVKPLPGTKLGHAFQEDGDCTTSDPCVRCGARSTPKSGHSYRSWVDDPTHNQHSRKCTNEGCNHVESASHVASPNDDDCTTPVVCTICGAKLGLGLSSHSFPENWSHDAQTHHRSCQNPGCGVRESYAHDRLGSVTRVEVAPDCDEPGREVILTFCATCGYEISREERTLEPTGHKFGDWKQLDTPSCDAGGTRQRTCEACGYTETEMQNANGHDWESAYQIDQPATCQRAGSESIHCKNCAATKDARTIPAIPHDYVQVKVLVEPNCTDNLIEEVECRYCNTISVRTQEGSAWGHDFDDYEPLYDATCTEDGHEKGYCTRCDEVDVREIPGSALGHTSSEESLRVVKAPTCTETGAGERICERCGETYETGVVIPATGHNFPDAWTGDTQGHHRSCQNEGCGERESKAHGPLQSTSRVEVAPDCDDPGLEEVLTFCTTCGYEVSREKRTLAATGHTFGDWEDLDAPTCDDTGSRQRTCSVCGFIETDIVNANGHDWEEEYTVDQEATCQAAGSESIHCKRCEATMAARTIPALPHDYMLVRVIQEPTCTDDQIEEVACTVCGTMAVRTQQGSALGHDFANYEPIDAATCTQNGHEKGYCTRCDEVNVREIPGSALGHDFTAYASMNDATCTQDGHEQSRCSRCGTVDVRTVPGSALGHTPTSAGRLELTAPTCTATGSTAYICVRCGEPFDAQILPALGHKPVEEASQAATCTQAGYTGGSVCSVCGATLRARAAILALGHSYGAWTSNGNGSHIQRCSRCGESKSEHCYYSEISIGATKVHVCKVCGDVVDPSNGETVTAGSFEVVAEAAAEEVDPGAIPSGCELIVRKLDIPFQDVEQVLEAFTIGCELDGRAFPLNGFIRVTMPVDCQMPFKLIRVDEDEDPETGEMVQTTVEIEFSYEDGHITFETDRDGIFLLTKLDEEA